MQKLGLGWSSVVKHFPSMHEALNSTPRTQKKKKNPVKSSWDTLALAYSSNTVYLWVSTTQGWEGTQGLRVDKWTNKYSLCSQWNSIHSWKAQMLWHSRIISLGDSVLSEISLALGASVLVLPGSPGATRWQTWNRGHGEPQSGTRLDS